MTINERDKEYTSEEAVEYCKRMARTHYENFTVVGPLLPNRFQVPFCIIYAWCRYADDLADETNDPEESIRLLNDWEEELEWSFSADSTNARHHPIAIALRDLVRRHRLPVEAFRDLLFAFRQDQTKCSYESFDELQNYCRHSANPVGRILLYLILDQPSPDQLMWSDAICTGLQLANFWQDIKRDQERGRQYIPRETTLEYPDFTDRMKYLVSLTREYFEQGRPLITALPFPLCLSIALFRAGGMAILDKIERSGFQTDRFRPRLSRFDKFRIALHAITDYFYNKISNSNADTTKG